MKIKQISVFLENKTGSLDKPCQILAENGISISALTLADTKEFGILRLVVKDWENAMSVLTKNGFMAKTTDVAAVEVDHKAGSLASVMKLISKHGIGIEYMYAFPSGIDGKAVIICRFGDPEQALTQLQSEDGIVFVSKEKLFAE